MSEITVADLRTTFAERVQAKRLELGLTQTQLASRAKTTQSAISEIESGDHSPNLDTIARIAKALRCKVLDLLA